MARRAMQKSDEREWIIPCNVKLNGADMIVRAETVEEAIAKARSNDWHDIFYAQAELVDWEPDYHAIRPND